MIERSFRESGEASRSASLIGNAEGPELLSVIGNCPSKHCARPRCVAHTFELRERAGVIECIFARKRPHGPAVKFVAHQADASPVRIGFGLDFAWLAAWPNPDFHLFLLSSDDFGSMAESMGDDIETWDFGHDI